MLLECHPWVEDDPSATMVNSELPARASLTRGNAKGAIWAAGQVLEASGAAAAGQTAPAIAA